MLINDKKKLRWPSIKSIVYIHACIHKEIRILYVSDLDSVFIKFGKLQNPTNYKGIVHPLFSKDSPQLHIQVDFFVDRCAMGDNELWHKIT